MSDNIRVEKLLSELDMESRRREAEFKKLVEEEKLPVNKVEVTNFTNTLPKVSTQFEHKRKYVHMFKEDLDLTNQDDREVFAQEQIYKKYVRGEQLPPLAIKDGRFVLEDFSDKDLTDLHILNEYYQNKYGSNLQEVLNRLSDDNDDNDLNDDNDNQTDSVKDIKEVKESIDNVTESDNL